MFGKLKIIILLVVLLLNQKSIPLFINGVNIGQIDIDSHVLDPFSEADERFRIC